MTAKGKGSPRKTKKSVRTPATKFAAIQKKLRKTRGKGRKK
jgi:hypothetical protein